MRGSRELAKTLRQRYGLRCEVVYVDDGSTDATLSHRPRT